jgi:DNA replication protein DnaC
MPSTLDGQLQRLRDMVRDRSAGNASPAVKAVPLDQQTWVCDAHGPWKPYVVDGQGVLRCRAPVCPSCAKESALRAMGRESETPPAFDGACLDSFFLSRPKQRLALSIIKRHANRMSGDDANQRAGGLVLWGASGTGKTHLAIGLMRHCQSKGRSGYFIRAVSLMESLKRSIAAGARSQDAGLIDRLSAVDVLVIDDVGKTPGTDFERSSLFHLLDNRWAYSRPTVITTNQQTGDLKDTITEAGFDRVTASGANIVRMEWGSYRSFKKG